MAIRRRARDPQTVPPPPAARRTPIERPVIRPLKAYALDPAAGRLLGNEMTINVRYEDLDPGPVVREKRGDAIAVIDYDGANGTYYQPVDLDDPGILIRGGLDPSESDPRFHQQMVYAVVTETIQHFEAALGRRIHWRRGDRASNPNFRQEHIWTLNIYPHAFVGRNAFYSPRAHGILFGYFRANEDAVGRNLPGQTVFTCLSHDVVVHETTHAIVDGIRAYFTEQTNPDVLSLHEAFADLAALFRHFTHGEILRDTIERTGGALYKYQLNPDAAMSHGDRYAPKSGSAPAADTPLLSSQMRARNPLIELAQQFGEATGREKALRSALSTEPNSDDIKKIQEPHLRGSILVAAVFDAFFAIYIKRTADLWRIFRAGGGPPNPVDIPGLWPTGSVKRPRGSRSSSSRSASARSTTARRWTSRSARTCARSSPPTSTCARATRSACAMPSCSRSACAASSPRERASSPRKRSPGRGPWACRRCRGSTSATRTG